MICRWCGEKLDPTQKKCPACGHNTQPASACGGFFDLAPGLEQRLPKVQQAEKHEPSPAVSADRPSGSPGAGGSAAQGRHTRKKRRLAWWLWPLSVAVLAIALVVMTVLYFGARAEIKDQRREAKLSAPAEVSASASDPAEESEAPAASENPAASEDPEGAPFDSVMNAINEFITIAARGAGAALKLNPEAATQSATQAGTTAVGSVLGSFQELIEVF